MRYGKTGGFGLSPHQREGVVLWSTREWDTLSREVDRLAASRDALSWQSFKTGIREQSAFRLPEGQHTRVVCCPVHHKSHWLWALLLLEEKVAIILDPLTSHTGRAGHTMIFKKLWYWREAVVVNGASPRPPPPFVVSLEGNRRRRVVDVLEMGGWGSSTGSQQEAWVSNVWEVPQQPDGSAGNSGDPHKGLVRAGHNRLGAAMGEEGQSMVPESSAGEHGWTAPRPLRPVRRGGSVQSH
jgi:hypothetical protein